MRAGTHIDLSFWCKSRSFACTKRQVKSGTHRDLLFQSISRCFASKSLTWGLGLMETSNSDSSHAGLHAENHSWSLGPIETCYSGPEVVVVVIATLLPDWVSDYFYLVVYNVLYCHYSCCTLCCAHVLYLSYTGMFCTLATLECCVLAYKHLYYCSIESMVWSWFYLKLQQFWRQGWDLTEQKLPWRRRW